MSSLPEDMYLDILSRVPVKSTYVCKCVCKSWFSLISHPDFVKSHLNHTIQRSNHNLIYKSFDDNIWYSISYDSLSSSNEYAAAVDLNFPYKSSRRISEYRNELLGSCNGLVYGRNKQVKFFFLWNPVTEEYKRLPKSPDDYCNFHSFGYDKKNDDYKLVMIHGHKESTSVQVYSLKSNSWKSFKTIPYEVIFNESSGVLVSGSLHWFGGIDKVSFIVSMDISEERFEKLQLPTTRSCLMNMGVLEEFLCVVAHFQEIFEVWVMQNHRVPESWCRLYTITYESIMCGFSFPKHFIGSVKLMGSLKSSEIVFKNTRNVILLYDPKFGTSRRSNIDGLMVRKAMSYFESLVSLNSISGVITKKKREITYILKKIRTKKRNRNVLEHRGDKEILRRADGMKKTGI